MKEKLINTIPITLIAIFIGFFFWYIWNKSQNTDIPIEEIIIKNSQLNIKYGETKKIEIEILPENATNTEILWTNDNSQLVTVQEDGTVIVNSNENGTANVKAIAKQNNVSASITINVLKVDNVINVSEIKLNPTEITLNYSETAKLSTTISPSNATNKNVVWSSSDPSLVTVDTNGNIKAVGNKNANATITASTVDGNYKASTKVTVIQKDTTVNITGIKLNPTEITLNYSETAKLSTTISPSNATNKNVVWSSSDPSLVTVDTNGNIKAVGNKNANATITATTVDGNYKASTKVTVIKKDSTVKVSGININQGSNSTVYSNSKNEIKVNLSATVYPSNATNKNIIWSSDNPSVATVNNQGTVVVNDLGIANIKVTTQDGNYTDTYKLTVKQKAIVVITASQGVRMNKWFLTYTSSKGNYYDKSVGTLKYIYKSGSGFDFQYGEGLEQAKNYINDKYGTKKKYVELSIFFTLTGNSVKLFTCDEINSSSEYFEIAKTYNNAIQSIKNLGFTNTKGFVISHSPLNTKHPLASKNNIVYSHKAEACQSGYRSAWKYWLSNKRMKSIVATGSYQNITFVDNFSNFVVINDEAKRTFTWLRKFSTPENDALHWDEETTIDYMQLAFDTAGM